MSEATMRSTLVKALRPLDAVAIESPMTGLGIPDVNYIGGWIECKYLKYWPKSCLEEPVKFQHPLSQQQKVWITRRSRAGGTVWVACQVARSWFFFNGMVMVSRWDQLTRPQMEYESAQHYPNGLVRRALVEWLRETSRG